MVVTGALQKHTEKRYRRQNRRTFTPPRTRCCERDFLGTDVNSLWKIDGFLCLCLFLSPCRLLLFSYSCGTKNSFMLQSRLPSSRIMPGTLLWRGIGSREKAGPHLFSLCIP